MEGRQPTDRPVRGPGSLDMRCVHTTPMEQTIYVEVGTLQLASSDFQAGIYYDCRMPLFSSSEHRTDCWRGTYARQALCQALGGMQWGTQETTGLSQNRPATQQGHTAEATTLSLKRSQPHTIFTSFPWSSFLLRTVTTFKNVNMHSTKTERVYLFSNLWWAIQLEGQQTVFNNNRQFYCSTYATWARTQWCLSLKNIIN